MPTSRTQQLIDHAISDTPRIVLQFHHQDQFNNYYTIEYNTLSREETELYLNAHARKFYFGWHRRHGYTAMHKD